MARRLWHVGGMKTTDQMPEKELRREAERAIREVRKGLAWAELRLRHLERVLRQLRALDPKTVKKLWRERHSEPSRPRVMRG